jgi:hypothetical protein
MVRVSLWRRVAILAAAVPLICAAGAPELERRLAADPENLDARGALIGLYYRSGQREAWLSQVLWTIEHHPESDLLQAWEISLTPRPPLGTAADFERAKALWLEQADRHPDDARVQANAAKGIWTGDFETSMRLMARARELDPKLIGRAAAIWTAALRSAMFVTAIVHPESPTRPDPVAVRARLETSGDAALVGLVGRLLRSDSDSLLAVFPAEANLPPEAMALMDRARADLALGDELLARAHWLNPGNGRRGMVGPRPSGGTPLGVAGGVVGGVPARAQ